MRLIIALLILISCKPEESVSDERKSVQTVDSIAVNLMRINDVHDYSSNKFLTLVKTEYVDSIREFKYLDDSAVYRTFSFDISHNQFQLIQDPATKKEDYLVCVDTCYFMIDNSLQQAYKYEIDWPPVDGNACYIFHPEHGLLANVAYTWRIRTVLFYGKQEEILRVVSPDLLDRENSYLRSCFIPPMAPEIGAMD